MTMRRATPPGANPAAVSGDRANVLARCVSLDLEVGRADERIHALAGVRPDTGQSLVIPRVGNNLAPALARLDDLADGADFVLGHNVIAHDLPYLRAADPGLRLLDLPAVDTLRLNPLAFPRNPYHYLVKHYQDGSLIRGRLTPDGSPARRAASLCIFPSAGPGKTSSVAPWLDCEQFHSQPDGGRLPLTRHPAI